VLRVIYIFKVYWGSYDITWSAYGAWIWLTVEAHVAVMCASAPALRIYFTHSEKQARAAAYEEPKGESFDTGKSLESGQRSNTTKKRSQWDVTVDEGEEDDAYDTTLPPLTEGPKQ
jgi:hypothetical protein